eukprot:TRINITY_DN9197_c0_g1_i3.p1 TRINITY_DN9197_c0_g1~~TRINITY_DN9197_c0_g1_i3.p1  ORF type:complete len:1337 (-),score=276.11 TRINITY_DN9197_c0_g1_i3:1163-5128(-)
MATQQSNFVVSTDSTGRQFYVNETTGERFLQLPGTAPSGPLASINPSLNDNLPEGWEKAVDTSGRIYFIDHINKKTSWTPPQSALPIPSYPLVQPYSQFGIPQPFGQMPLLAGQSQPGVLMVPSVGQTVQSSVPGGPIGGTNPILVPQGLAQTAYPPAMYRRGLPLSTSPNNLGSGVLGSSYGSGATGTMQYAPHLQTGRMTHVMTLPRSAFLSQQVTSFEPQEGPNCVKCDVEFSFFSRKHHCRCCNREYCDECSQGRSDVRIAKLTSARVCDFCKVHLERGDESCASRLVPYLLGKNDDLKLQALTELSSLLQTDRNMEGVPNIKIIPALWTLLSGLTNSVEIKTRGLEVFSLIVSKGVSMSLTFERVAVLLNMFLTPSLSVTTAKALAFLSMQGQNKLLLMSGNILGPLFESLSGGAVGAADLEWSAMAIYYLAASSLDDVVARGLGENVNIRPLILLLSAQSEKLLQFTTGTLEIISVQAENASAIYENHGIEPLLRLLGHSDRWVKTNVLGILTHLCAQESAQQVILQFHGMKYLVELLASTTEESLQVLALELILKLCTRVNYPLVLPELVGALPFIGANLASSNAAIQNSVLKLMQHLVHDETACSKAGSSGVIPPLITVLSSTDTEEVDRLTEVLGILVSLCVGCSGNLKILVECGVLNIMFEYLAAGSNRVMEEATKALAELSGCNDFFVDVTRDVLGLLQDVAVKLLNTQSPSILRNLTCLVSNLAKDPTCAASLTQTPEELTKIVKLLLVPNPVVQCNVSRTVFTLAKVPEQSDSLSRIPVLVQTLILLLGSPNPDVREEACFSLLECCRTSANNRQVVFQTQNGIITMIRLLAVKDTQIKLVASEVVYLFSKEPQFRIAIRECGGLNILVENLFDVNHKILEFSALTLANEIMTEKDSETICCLGGVLSLINLLSSPPFPFSVASAAASAIVNLAHAEICQKVLIEGGAVKKLLEITKQDDQVAKLQAINALAIISSDRSVATLLPQNDGIEILSKFITNTDNAELRGHAVHLITNVCRGVPDNWREFVNVGGLNFLVILASSLNMEAQRLAVHEIAELSVDTQKHGEISSLATSVLMNFLTTDPQNGRPLGSPSQIDSLLIVANISHSQTGILAVLTENQRALSSVVALLNLDNGASALLSATRILNNLTQHQPSSHDLLRYVTPPTALPTNPTSNQCLSKLVTLLSLQNQVDVEIKWNILCCLRSLVVGENDITTVITNKGILLLLRMLDNSKNSSEVETQDAVAIRQLVVELLSRMMSFKVARDEIRTNKDCLSLLLYATTNGSVGKVFWKLFSKHYNLTWSSYTN